MAQRKQTNEQKCTREMGRTRRHGSIGDLTFHRAMVCVIAIVLAGAVAGCSLKATQPQIPGAGAGPVSTLVFDNQVSDSIGSLFFGEFQLLVTIDGFSPTERRYLPTGQTTLQLPAGSHEMIIKAEFSGKGMYYFNPTRVSFDTESTKSYTITFSRIGTMMKRGYRIQYSGWSTEQSAGWPSEVYIANPLFGGLSPIPNDYLTQRQELAYTILEGKGGIYHETHKSPATNHPVYSGRELRLCLNPDKAD